MIIGFTGTQLGMTGKQKDMISYLVAFNGPVEGHHGDCIGADAEFDEIVVRHCGAETIRVHPPDIDTKRAFTRPTDIEPKPYLERNHDIVDACDLLFAAPSGEEVLRSGTWATIRYARKIGRKGTIVWPNGQREPINKEEP